MTAETRAPLRQARLFFLYPATLAGATIAAYVSSTRAIAGLAGFREDIVVGKEGLNLVINVLVIATALYFGRKDIVGKDALLEQVAIELGEKQQPSNGVRDD